MKEIIKIREFRKVLRQFERALTYQVNCTQCHGVSLSQCHTLLEIAEKGKTNTGELAKSMELDKSTVSRTIDGLVKNGLVKREDHPEDRRYTQLSLSKEGKLKCAQINNKNDDYFKQVLQLIPTEKHDSIFEFFNLFVDAMKKTTYGGHNHDQDK